jgi:hypothetical protein
MLGNCAHWESVQGGKVSNHSDYHSFLICFQCFGDTRARVKGNNWEGLKEMIGWVEFGNGS